VLRPTSDTSNLRASQHFVILSQALCSGRIAASPGCFRGWNLFVGAGGAFSVDSNCKCQLSKSDLFKSGGQSTV
jgi:hypothetical protein